MSHKHAHVDTHAHTHTHTHTHAHTHTKHTQCFDEFHLSLPLDVPLLQMCDDIRDNQLAELGVRLEDRGGTYVIKIVGKEAIMQAREEERLVSVCQH